MAAACVFSLFVPAALLLVIAGSAFAAVVEPFSGRLDHNLPVPLLPG
jgi:hypothetical protein